jgi:hypothetical protein
MESRGGRVAARGGGGDGACAAEEWGGAWWVDKGRGARPWEGRRLDQQKGRIRGCPGLLIPCRENRMGENTTHPMGGDLSYI